MVITNISTIIWDLDGTLLDSFDIFTEIVAEVLPRHAIPVPPVATLRNNFHGSLESAILAAIGVEHESRLRQIVTDFLEVQNHHYETVEHHLHSDALSLARRAAKKGIYQILVTNRAHEGRLNASPRHIVEQSSLTQLIDQIICGDDTHHRKPDILVLDDTKIDPTHTLVIGDQFVDAQFAINLGAEALLVNRSTEPIAHLDKLGLVLPKTVHEVSSLQSIDFV